MRTLPRHAVDRVRARRDGRRLDIEHYPWVGVEAVSRLEQVCAGGGTALEFGSGGSTRFFAERLHRLYSVEESPAWHAAVTRRLAEAGLTNVDLTLADVERLGRATTAHRDAYVEAHPQLEDASLDLVFVDGEYRDACALRGLRLLRPGGVLVLDNANTYLPGPTRSPWRVAEPASARWQRFAELTRRWDRTWTTNGVWDTAFWVRP
ncbi:O-methyltransferase [Jatrophihabitans fulvus]